MIVSDTVAKVCEVVVKEAKKEAGDSWSLTPEEFCELLVVHMVKQMVLEDPVPYNVSEESREVVRKAVEDIGPKMEVLRDLTRP